MNSRVLCDRPALPETTAVNAGSVLLLAGFRRARACVQTDSAARACQAFAPPTGQTSTAGRQPAVGFESPTARTGSCSGRGCDGEPSAESKA